MPGVRIIEQDYLCSHQVAMQYVCVTAQESGRAMTVRTLVKSRQHSNQNQFTSFEGS
jgi:hypothetical protein